MTGLSIGEAAAKAGISVHTLRYYERSGLIPPVARNDAGRRVFGETDLAWTRYAICLRGLGMGVAEIARYVAAAERSDGESEQMLLLEGHIERMRSQRAELDYFIDVAETKLATKRVKP